MPKGLDTMLVDDLGGVIITNDGVTILENMEARHPAAQMLIGLARTQELLAGDGTTTAVVLAASLVAEGVEHIVKGVPPSKLVEGIQDAIKSAITEVAGRARAITGLDDRRLLEAAIVAARGDMELAQILYEGACALGLKRLSEPEFRLADEVLTLTAGPGVSDKVISLVRGVVIERYPVLPEMPERMTDVKVLILDDALEPERLTGDALSSEHGLARNDLYLEAHRQLVSNIIGAGIKLVVADRTISDDAAAAFAEAGVMAIRRVSTQELRRLVRLTGAKPVKKRRLEASLDPDLVGHAAIVEVDNANGHVLVQGNAGVREVTIMVSGSTSHVAEERGRVARDAAWALQGALTGGWVPGGGAVEIAVSRKLSAVRNHIKGLAAYGWDCVVNSLRKPLSQMAVNAGFSALQVVGDVVAAQESSESDCIAMDSDTGCIADMTDLGIVDPLVVKVTALKAAAEVACSILRVSTIIRKKEGSPVTNSAFPDRFYNGSL